MLAFSHRQWAEWKRKALEDIPANRSWEDLGIGYRGREHAGLSKAALLPPVLLHRWTPGQNGALLEQGRMSHSAQGLQWGKHFPLVDASAPVSTCYSKEN